MSQSNTTIQYDFATTVAPSLTVSFHGLVHKLRGEGKKIFDLTVGEAKVPTPPQILEHVQKTLEVEPTYYPPAPGLHALRDKAAQWMNETYGSTYNAAQTLVTGGGKYGLHMLMQSFLRPGDEAIVLAPYWVSYPALTRLFGAEPVFVEGKYENQFRVQPEELKAAITSKTRLLILNNAANPTGALYSKEALQALLQLAKDHDLMVISDEVYSELIYDGEFVSCAAFEAFSDRVFIVQSCSKNFAMTGWRIGFVFGHQEVIQQLIRLQGQGITSASVVGQWAALAAFEHAKSISHEIRTTMKQRRDTFIRTFQELFGVALPVPASALYTFLPMTAFGFTEEEARDSMTLCKDILQYAHVAMVPGEGFGVAGYARCSFSGQEADLIEGLKRVKEYVQARSN